MWEEDKSGEYIHVNDYKAFYVAHGVKMKEIHSLGQDLCSDIRKYMKDNNFYPNIWEVNERGNVTLMNSRGLEIGGLV